MAIGGITPKQLAPIFIIMKRHIREFLGPLGWDYLSRTRAYQAIREPSWHITDPRARSSRRDLQNLAGIHKGETCFIIGGGPSLFNTDLSAINGRLSIGLNRLYLGFDQLKFQPTYMVCVNELLMSQWGEEFSLPQILFFTSWSSRRYAPAGSIFLRTQTGTQFSKNLVEQIFVGSTVTYAAIQLAFWMGVETLVLVGIDHNYAFEKHEKDMHAHTKVERHAEDYNHFAKNYFGKGAKWQLPDLIGSEHAYQTAKHVFEQSGRQIYDATIGGKLEVFEKRPFSDFL